MTNDELFALLDKKILEINKETYKSTHEIRSNYVITWVRLGHHLNTGGVVNYSSTVNAYASWRDAERYTKAILNALMKHDPEKAKENFAAYLGMTPNAFQNMLDWEEEVITPHAS